MPMVLICDASGEQLDPAEAVTMGWGRQRVYSPAAAKDVEEYFQAVQKGAEEARELFLTRKEEAAAQFNFLYMDGKLPDEIDEPD